MWVGGGWHEARGAEGEGEGEREESGEGEDKDGGKREMVVSGRERREVVGNTTRGGTGEAEEWVR